MILVCVFAFDAVPVNILCADLFHPCRRIIDFLLRERKNRHLKGMLREDILRPAICNRDRIIYSLRFFTRKRAINHRMVAVKLQYICIAACHGHMLVIAVRHDAVLLKNRRSRHLQITRNLCKVNRLRFVDKISDKTRIFINQSFFHRSFFFFGALFNCDIKEFKAFCRFCCRTLRCHFLHSIVIPEVKGCCRA